jgi:hypothetical protein
VNEKKDIGKRGVSLLLTLIDAVLYVPYLFFNPQITQITQIAMNTR